MAVRRTLQIWHPCRSTGASSAGDAAVSDRKQRFCASRRSRLRRLRSSLLLACPVAVAFFPVPFSNEYCNCVWECGCLARRHRLTSDLHLPSSLAFLRTCLGTSSRRHRVGGAAVGLGSSALVPGHLAHFGLDVYVSTDDLSLRHK